MAGILGQGQTTQRTNAVRGIGDALQSSFAAYLSEYPKPFEQHYTYIEIGEATSAKMGKEDFNRLSQEIQTVLKEEDAVGSLNFYQGRFYGMLVMDRYSREKLEALSRDLQGDMDARATLTIREPRPDGLDSLM